MKGVQCYELFGGIALKNHACFNFFFLIMVDLFQVYKTVHVCEDIHMESFSTLTQIHTTA